MVIKWKFIHLLNEILPIIWGDLLQGQFSTGPTISEVEKQKLRYKSTPLIAKIFYKNCTFCQGKTIPWNNGTVKQTPQPQVCGSIKPVNSENHRRRKIFCRPTVWQILLRILKKFNQWSSTTISSVQRWSSYNFFISFYISAKYQVYQMFISTSCPLISLTKKCEKGNLFSIPLLELFTFIWRYRLITYYQVLIDNPESR